MYFDWHRFHADRNPAPAIVDPRRRLRVCLAVFVAALAVVFARVAQLDVSQGEAFRAEAARPLVRRIDVPGVRGRILARDGAVLACDRQVPSLAVHYRYLQQPCQPAWLRLTARARLTPLQRRVPGQVAAVEKQVLAEREELARRLARLCHIPPQQWEHRARQIQARVERIAENVNRRRLAEAARPGHGPATPELNALWHGDFSGPSPGGYLLEVLKSSLGEAPPGRLTVAEELDYHVLAEDIPLAVVVEVQSHPESYPGVKIVEQSRRVYPGGTLAAHALGYLGPWEKGDATAPADAHSQPAEDAEGKTGLERQYERLLRPRHGTAVELVDHTGRIMATYREREPAAGRDLVLSLHSRLQVTAETLLDRAVERRAVTQSGQHPEPAGGAIVVLDVHSGAILTAASAPRYDPSLFGRGSSPELTRLLADPAHPLVDRVAGMAIPPGSVFKVLTSVALLQSAALDPQEPWECRGYLDQPDHWRCAIYQRYGTGHGPLALADALAQSCNVYFFHHARQMGPAPLVDWAGRFGFGRRTGVDLPGEAAGVVPDGDSIQRLEKHPWRPSDTLSMSIGQGSLTATPLQVVRMLAAVANGGRLVTPHLVTDLGLPQRAPGATRAGGAEAADVPADDLPPIAPPEPIPALKAETLAAIRAGLVRTVEDPRGTAHATAHLECVTLAGKTGTAQTGGNRADHAWFAGYVPAEQPQVAFVVVLEHAGDAATAACPLAKRLVERMLELGLLEPGAGQRP